MEKKLTKKLDAFNAPKKQSNHKSDAKKSVKHGDTLTKYYKSIARYRVLTRKQEEIIFTKVANGDIVARNLAIKHNLKLVASIAKKYAYGDRQLQLDLIQEGNAALIEIIDKYDVTLGNRFATYATYWIKERLLVYVYKNRNVKVPINMREDISKLKKAKESFFQRELKEANYEELCEELPDIKPSRVLRLIEAEQMEWSLNKKIENDKDDSIEYLDTYEDTTVLSASEIINIEDTKRDVNDLVNSLSERHKNIVVKKFGLDGKGEHSLTEIGKSLGISCERVRQIMNDDFKKFRKEILTNPRYEGLRP